MNSPALNPFTHAIGVQKIAEYIRNCQQQDGGIRWFKDGKLDPWDHTECAIALTIAGDTHNAKKAYQWLSRNQNTDGSWQANYFFNPDSGYVHDTLQEEDTSRIETNFVAYPATGLWHYLVATNDHTFAAEMYPAIEKAINYVISHQSFEGDVQWAISTKHILAKDSLVTGCCSILRSIECAILLAKRFDRPHASWSAAYLTLANALKNKPWRFDRTWESKSRYSMDWFYPILAGIYTYEEAQNRLRQNWNKFIVDGTGCRCVSDEPWVTIAETCEFILALVAANEHDKAQLFFQHVSQWQDKDGGYWTGFNYRDKVLWPKEKPSWTAAAVLLAADAIYKITPANALFTQPSSLL